MAKDYYKILGVKETDSKDTIKKAYRDAVKRLHPDVKGRDFDKSRFYDIQEAYETLSDEERRKHYDRSRETAEKQRKWRDEMEEIFPRMDDIWESLMKGWGLMFGDQKRSSERWEEEIPHRAKVFLSPEEARGGVTLTVRVPVEKLCDFCEGTGRWGFHGCPVCGGAGRIRSDVPVRISIPSGMKEGTEIRVPFRERDGTRHVIVLTITINRFT